MECCGLCRQPVSSKDRRLLHGGTCDKEVAILNFLISATWPGHSIRSSVELSRERTFICTTCKGTLKKYKNACDQIAEYSSLIISKINIGPNVPPPINPSSSEAIQARLVQCVYVMRRVTKIFCPKNHCSVL